MTQVELSHDTYRILSSMSQDTDPSSLAENIILSHLSRMDHDDSFVSENRIALYLWYIDHLPCLENGSVLTIDHLDENCSSCVIDVIK